MKHGCICDNLHKEKHIYAYNYMYIRVPKREELIS